MCAAIGMAFALVLLVPQRAHAGPITFQGVTYTMSGAQSGPGAFSIQLLVDASGFDQGLPAFLTAVAPKLAGMTGVVLDDAPGGAGNWTTYLGGLNANGCQSSSPNGFFCSTTAMQSTSNAAGPGNGIMTFNWTVMMPSLPDTASLKAEFTDSSGNKVGGLLSQEIGIGTLTPVPEPGSLLLLATGLLGLAWLLWRRRTYRIADLACSN
ncbi:MAG: PEP-CTERM sorting domain-containing protein [Terriglobales bacterium]